MGGSMGRVVGEKFVHGVNAAIKNKCPFICVHLVGAQECKKALITLMQMAKTAHLKLS